MTNGEGIIENYARQRTNEKRKWKTGQGKTGYKKKLTFRARQAKPEQAEQGGEIKGWRKAVKVQIKQLPGALIKKEQTKRGAD